MICVSHWLSNLYHKLIEYCEPREIVAFALLDTEIAKHLKWINVFGALLGALIGFSQVIMRIIRLV